MTLTYEAGVPSPLDPLATVIKVPVFRGDKDGQFVIAGCQFMHEARVAEGPCNMFFTRLRNEKLWEGVCVCVLVS